MIRNVVTVRWQFRCISAVWGLSGGACPQTPLKPLCLSNLHGLPFQPSAFELYIFIPVMAEGPPLPTITTTTATENPGLHCKACSSHQIKLSRYGHEEETVTLHFILFQMLILTVQRSNWYQCDKSIPFKVKIHSFVFYWQDKVCGSFSDISTFPQLNIFV